MHYLEHISIYIPLLVCARNCKFLVQRVAAFIPINCSLPPSLPETAQTFVLSILKRQDGAYSLSLPLSLSLLVSHLHIIYSLLQLNSLLLSFSFWFALFIALSVLFVASPPGHTRGNSSSSVSNLPRLSNRTLEGGYPRATCGEAYQVSWGRRR